MALASICRAPSRKISVRTSRDESCGNATSFPLRSSMVAYLSAPRGGMGASSTPRVRRLPFSSNTTSGYTSGLRGVMYIVSREDLWGGGILSREDAEEAGILSREDVERQSSSREGMSL